MILSRDYEVGFDSHDKDADLGCVASCKLASASYMQKYNELGSLNDLEMCHKYLLIASERGDAECQFQLSRLYINEDYSFLFKPIDSQTWLERSADQGNLSAMRGIALRFKTGWQHILVDYTEFARWTTRAAEAGCEDSFRDVMELGL